MTRLLISICLILLTAAQASAVAYITAYDTNIYVMHPAANAAQRTTDDKFKETYNVEEFGAFRNLMQLPKGSGCSISASSTTLTCPAGTFVSGDVGKIINVDNAAAGNVYSISGIATGNPAVLTMTTVSTLREADNYVYIENVGTTPDINGAQDITVTTTTEMTVPVNVTAVSDGTGTATDMIPLMATISGYTSDTTVTLSTAATYSVTSERTVFGSDNRADIQEAIDAAATYGGGVLHVPAGTYGIDRHTALELPDDFSLVGDGTATLFAFATTTTGFAPMVKVPSTTTNARVTDLTFDTNYEGRELAADMIEVAGENVLISRNTFINSAGTAHNALGYAVYLTGSFKDVMVVENKCIGISQCAITADDATGSGLVFVANICDGLHRTCLNNNTPSGSLAHVIGAYNVIRHVYGVRAPKRGIGFGCSSDYSSPSSPDGVLDGVFMTYGANVLLDAGLQGFHVERGCAWQAVYANTFFEPGKTAGTSGVGAGMAAILSRSGAKLQGVAMVGNSVIGNGDAGSESTEIGGFVGGSQPADVKYMLLNDNTIRDVKDDAFWVGDTTADASDGPSYVMVSGNHGYGSVNGAGLSVEAFRVLAQFNEFKGNTYGIHERTVTNSYSLLGPNTLWGNSSTANDWYQPGNLDGGFSIDMNINAASPRNEGCPGSILHRVNNVYMLEVREGGACSSNTWATISP